MVTNSNTIVYTYFFVSMNYQNLFNSLKTRNDRNKFMDETIGMMKKDREDYYISNHQ